MSVLSVPIPPELVPSLKQLGQEGTQPSAPSQQAPEVSEFSLLAIPRLEKSVLLDPEIYSRRESLSIALSNLEITKPEKVLLDPEIYGIKVPIAISDVSKSRKQPRKRGRK
jgi:hypothetical protein